MQNLNNIEYIQFTICDTGIGLSQEQKNKLFNPFEKGSSKNNDMGSGLGLNIVKDICYKMQGVIKFESQLGKGTTFWVSFPLIFMENNGEFSQSQEILEIQLNSLHENEFPILRKESAVTLNNDLCAVNFRTKFKSFLPNNKESRESFDMIKSILN